MLPERWAQIKDKLNVALELGPKQRAEYLEAIANEDPELRRELESLIASHNQAATDFLDQPVTEIAKLPLLPGNDLIGRRLGPYELVCQIGAGGMGEVYRAFRADDQYRKEVAIKLVRTGPGATLTMERFRNERQILATLEHPNICLMLDGGTTQEGLPYFVMELIEGKPIDVYCNEHRLSIQERLKLFLQVCSAVQYAHQRLIIHRDIKPLNILVTRDGVPKLLDFGIAKILDENGAGKHAVTMTAFQVLTAGYASPEQVRGETITTASDVYSLGVVLYELLTGESPYRVPKSSSHEITRAVCEEEPLRPSTIARQKEETGSTASSTEKLSKRLHGDLDNIVLMALRKEAVRRYPSVEQFAGDIRRHLQNLPVTARQDTLRYRTSKFVARHTAGVVGAIVAALALTFGLAIAVHEAHIARVQAEVARQERARAERRFNDVRKLANSLLFEVHDSIKDLPGSTPARKLLVSRALEYLDSLSQESKTDASLQREMAAAYEKIGDVQGQPRQANLGDPAGAAVSYQKALAIRESLAQHDPQDLELGRQLIPNYGKLSDLLWASGDSKAAMDYSDKAFSTAVKLYGSSAVGPQDRAMLAAYYMDHGYKQAEIGGDRSGGLATMQTGTTMLEQMASADPKNLRVRRYLYLSYSRIAQVVEENPGDRPRAAALYKKALSSAQSLVAAEPTNAEFRRLSIYGQFSLGEILAELGDKTTALAYDRQALSGFQALAAADPANAQLQQDIGRVRAEMGQVMIAVGQLVAGMEQLRLSLAMLANLPDAKNPNTLAGFAVVNDEFWMGKAHRSLAASDPSPQKTAEHYREAESWFKKSLPGFETVRDHGLPQYRGAARVSEVNQEIAQCERGLSGKNAH